MTNVGRVAALIEELAPLHLKMDWDNVGLQIGSIRAHVGRILVTLTVTEDTVTRAIEEGVGLVVAHHPLIFRPIRTVRTDTPQGALLQKLLSHGIAVYVSHTNLDTAPDGLNHWLAQELELQRPEVLVPGSEPGTGLGRVGNITASTTADLAVYIAERLGTDVRVIGSRDAWIERVAVCGGSGGDLYAAALKAGAQALVTGDVSYHDALDATAHGLVVFDAGHFGTEKIMVSKLAAYLRSRLSPDVEVLEEAGLDPFAM
ncbi:MAG: Nif3-like dinuclear metal center hexameric protein [Firmicutes bacterium]|nr:Nif3-like dinuclear metal center hexameric protein [Bacillota bacterium]